MFDKDSLSTFGLVGKVSYHYVESTLLLKEVYRVLGLEWSGYHEYRLQSQLPPSDEDLLVVGYTNYAYSLSGNVETYIYFFKDEYTKTKFLIQC